MSRVQLALNVDDRLDRGVNPAAGSGVGGCGTDADTFTQADQTASAGACCPV